MRTLTLLFLLLSILWCVPSWAATDIRWTPQTKLWLAQCMEAEAGESEQDHAAIAYAAENWLALRRKKYPSLRYADVLRAYCSVHKLSIGRLSPRQLWIRQLGLPTRDILGNVVLEKPEAFPSKSSWERKRRIWLQTLQRAQDWYDGKLKDPCHGRAVHWGAPSNPDNWRYLPSDEPSEKLVRLKCSDHLLNDYYRYKTGEELARNETRHQETRRAIR